jgi:hypothetical protein
MTLWSEKSLEMGHFLLRPLAMEWKKAILAYPCEKQSLSDYVVSSTLPPPSQDELASF